jgi:holin-like protein
MIKGFAIVLFTLILGEGMVYYLKISVPGNVLGLIAMFLLLYFKLVKLEDVDEVATGLVKNLGLFFVPVILMFPLYFDYFKAELIPIVAALTISFPLTLIAAGWVTQRLMGGKDNG